MKKLTIALSLFAIFGAANADTMFTAKNEIGGSMNMTDNTSAQCRATGKDYRVAYSLSPDRNVAPLRGCWKFVDDYVHILWDGGGERMFEFASFRLTEYGQGIVDRANARKTGNAL
jgi:hypothetical protein